MTDDLTEFLCRPSDVINGLIAAGFRIVGLWEPQYEVDQNLPCIFRAPNPWFVKAIYSRVPQYMIVKAVAEEYEVENHRV